MRYKTMNMVIEPQWKQSMILEITDLSFLKTTICSRSRTAPGEFVLAARMS